jgi:hypothetical protein
MPAGQPIYALPSLQQAKNDHLARPPAKRRPAVWRPLIVPNLDAWQPGDIVLVNRRGLSGAAIGPGQVLLGPTGSAARRWSHCAIYVGDGLVVDAVPRGGVGIRSLEGYCARRATALLRLEIDGAFLSREQGLKVAARARELAGKRYAYGALVGLAFKRLLTVLRLPVPRSNDDPEVKRLFCSSLVVVAYNAINVPIEQDPNVAPCLPANLPLHSNLWSQDLRWHPALK